MLKGIAVSEGYAIAPILKIKEYEMNIIPSKINNPEKEIHKYEEAIAKSVDQLNELKTKYANKFDDNMLSLFDAHVTMCQDIDVVSKVKDLITKEKYNLTYALSTVVNEYIEMFNQMDDDYLKSRAVDLKDVSSRIIKNALGLQIIDFAKINKEVILAIHELTPSQATQLDPKYIKGFVSEVGGTTSHSAIVAKLLKIPAVFGITDVLNKVSDDETVIIDGFKGMLYDQPSDALIASYKTKIKTYERDLESLQTYKSKSLLTKDLNRFDILVNLGSTDEIKYLNDDKVDGIGLFRTELLFLEKHRMPTVEEQFEAYKKLLLSFEGQPVTIRTLDIGGDKPLPYFNHDKEFNPSLGYRGIRLLLNQKTLFKTQITALLRASVYGHLKIMFPMISTYEEFMEAKEFTKKVEKELIQEGVEVSSYELGMMIEVPSAAILADILAPECDFFSIGTNDLIQYTLATDRLNPKLNYLYQPFNPAILKLIKTTVDAANKFNTSISVCGETASHPLSAMILLGLGVKQLSVTPNALLEIKSFISAKTMDEINEITEHVMKLKTQKEILDYIEKIAA